MIYMDACCLNRPFDDQRQLRIRLESEAITIMLEKFQNGEWVWPGSEVLSYELRQNPDVEKRYRTLALAQMAHEHKCSISVRDRGQSSSRSAAGFQREMIILENPKVEFGFSRFRLPVSRFLLTFRAMRSL
jgi:hypothetical protein